MAVAEQTVAERRAAINNSNGASGPSAGAFPSSEQVAAAARMIKVPSPQQVLEAVARQQPEATCHRAVAWCSTWARSTRQPTACCGWWSSLTARRWLMLAPDVGFLHTGIEKNMEAKTYQKAVALTDRTDYLGPMINNLVYALAVEKLLDCEMPPRAQVGRVLLNELTRMNSYLVWLGTHALDLAAMSVFLYCFREREMLLDIFELVSGARMMTSYIRPGGLAWDFPEEFKPTVQAFLDICSRRGSTSTKRC